MTAYKLVQPGVERLTDKASIPPATGNRDWQDYQQWLAQGNIPQPADPTPPPTPQQLREQLYPGIWTYLEALYQSRHGNNAPLTALDQTMAAAYLKYPD